MEKFPGINKPQSEVEESDKSLDEGTESLEAVNEGIKEEIKLLEPEFDRMKEILEMNKHAGDRLRGYYKNIFEVISVSALTGVTIADVYLLKLALEELAKGNYVSAVGIGVTGVFASLVTVVGALVINQPSKES